MFKATSRPPLGPGGARPAPGLRALDPNARRCIVKARYVVMNAYGQDAARLHLRYLERDGVERDGSAGRLYGATSEFDGEGFGEPIIGERHQFRFIVSPEDANRIDLSAYARGLMEQVERDLRRPLLWAAVNHHNTDNPHVHIVVRGVDRSGKLLRIPPGYIAHGMRETAERALTLELGLRNVRDIARQRTHELTWERLTPLDRKLATFSDRNGRITAEALERALRDDRSAFHARLEILERLRVASRVGPGWQLSPDWDATLKRMGERDDIMRRLHYAVHGDPSRYRAVHPSTTLAPIEGLVRAKGLHDELSGSLFAAIETQSGETYYLPLQPSVADQVREGDIVRVAADVETWVKPTDRILARFAELNAGIYDPVAHARNLERMKPSGPSPGSPSVPDLVAANARRLERLAKYGLAAPLPDGRWRVPADLVAQLEARANEFPRQRITVKRLSSGLARDVNYEGPTWLDNQGTDRRERAGYGFGAEVAAASRRRETALRQLGIDPATPDRESLLRQREALALGRRLTAELGLQFEPSRCGLRGQLQLCDALPSGNVYVRIVEPISRRFTVLPATADSERFVGRQVELTADESGRLSIRSTLHRSRGSQT